MLNKYGSKVDRYDGDSFIYFRFYFVSGITIRAVQFCMSQVIKPHDIMHQNNKSSIISVAFGIGVQHNIA
jgi:hypothetical protein